MTTKKMRPLSKNQANALHLLCDDAEGSAPMVIIVRGGPPQRIVGLGIHLIPDNTLDALMRRGLVRLVASGFDEKVADAPDGIALSKMSRLTMNSETYGRNPVPTDAGRALHATFEVCP